MISTLEKEITFRFLKARKKDGFLNVISIFSFIGISLGVAVLIIVMSVMNGFRSELINKIVGFNAHITVDTYENQIQIDKVKNTNLNLIASEMILSNSGEAIIIKKDTSKGIILRGYSRKDFPKLKIIKDKTFVGNKSNLTGNYISLGKELSFTLNLKLGDDVSIMSSSGVDTIIGSIPKKKSFTIVSLFESGLADFDNNVAFINIDTLDEFMNDVYGSSDRLTITQSWVNRSDKNCHHPMHKHPNSILSGVWYPSIHEDSPPIQFNKNTPSVSFKKHTNNAYNSDNCLIPMKAGDLIIFPSNLSHCVPPNKIDQERVSLSFNTWATGSMGDKKSLTYLPCV